MMRTRYDINKETLSLKRYITDDLAVNFRSQLEHALKETEKPLRVTSDCIYNRENRMGIDRVKDDVESRLNLESDSIRNTANKLKDTLNSVLFIILFESSCKEIISVCQLKIIYGHFVTLFLVWSFFTFWFWWLTFKMCWLYNLFIHFLLSRSISKSILIVTRDTNWSWTWIINIRQSVLTIPHVASTTTQGTRVILHVIYVHNLHICRSINIHGGIEKIDSTISIPETWSHFSQNNIQHSQGKWPLSSKENLYICFQGPGLSLKGWGPRWTTSWTRSITTFNRRGATPTGLCSRGSRRRPVPTPASGRICPEPCRRYLTRRNTWTSSRPP